MVIRAATGRPVCTVVLLIRPGHAWPLILAANRDERLDRLWDPPAAHWPDQPGVIAGRDRSGGGTWMGVNRHGVAAAVLNRPGSLRPAELQPGAGRSRRSGVRPRPRPWSSACHDARAGPAHGDRARP